MHYPIIKKNLPIFWNKFKTRYKNNAKVDCLSVVKTSKVKQILNKIKKLILESLYVTISAQIMILPITILNFNTVSLTFFISNVLASFLIGPITIGGFLILIISFISIKFASKISVILQILLKLLMLVSKFCSKLPLSKIYVITPSIFSIVLYEVFILFPFIMKNKRRRKYIKICANYLKNNKIYIIILISIILINIFFSYYRFGLTIHFIDVGQGDSMLIITKTNKKY